MKWIYPAFKFNNGLMPQSGSASHNAPVKRKEAGATRNCLIKPILEKWMRQICLLWVVLSCAVSCVPEGVTHVQTGIHPKWLTAQPVLFFFSLSLFIFSMVAFVWKREAQSTIFRRLSLLLQTFMFRRGFKVQMYTFFDFPPSLCFYDSASRPRPKRRKKKSSHCKTCILRALGVFSFLF